MRAQDKALTKAFVATVVLFSHGIAPAQNGADAGRVYHVHPEGDDVNSGTSPTSPWQTIARANRQEFRPGDQLLFAGGHSFEGNLVLTSRDAGTPRSPVIVGSYGPGRATIQAGDGTAVLVRDAGGVEVRDLICRGGDRARNHGCGVAFVNTLPGHVRLQHVRIQNVDASDFGRDVRTLVGKLAGHQPPAGCGVFVGGAASDDGKSGFEDIAITGCSLHHNEFFGALLTGCWDEKATRYANARLVVSDCRFFLNPGDPDYREHHSGSGLLVEDTDGGLVDRCTAWENGSECRDAPGGPCGIWTADSRRIVIQRCEAFGNRTASAADGDGFDLDGGSLECTLQYNYSHHNDGAGILVYTYPYAPRVDRGNVVRYNVCEENSAKLRDYGEISVGNDGHGMSNVQIYQNSLIARRDARAVINVHGKDLGVSFRNNLVLAPGGAPLVFLEHDAPDIVFQGNLYWAGGAGFRVVAPKSCASLEEWRTAGKETIQEKSTGLFIDPRLPLDEPSGRPGDLSRIPRLNRFRPPSGSPAIDAGLDLLGRFGIETGGQDFLTNRAPAGLTTDIGAVERP